jgi:hypothetical protein
VFSGPAMSLATLNGSDYALQAPHLTIYAEIDILSIEDEYCQSFNFKPLFSSE